MCLPGMMVPSQDNLTTETCVMATDALNASTDRKGECVHVKLLRPDTCTQGRE